VVSNVSKELAVYIINICPVFTLHKRRIRIMSGVGARRHFNLGTGHTVVFKVQYENEIKYVLRLTQLSLYLLEPAIQTPLQPNRT